jgi:hypothetical protein
MNVLVCWCVVLASRNVLVCWVCGFAIRQSGNQAILHCFQCVLVCWGEVYTQGITWSLGLGG